MEELEQLMTKDFLILLFPAQMVKFQFFPTRFSINDYDITNVSYNLDDNLLGAGTTIIGQSIIDTSSVAISYGHSSTIVGIDSGYNSAKVLVQLTADSYHGNEFEFTQLNITHNGNEVFYV